MQVLETLLLVLRDRSKMGSIDAVKTCRQRIFLPKCRVKAHLLLPDEE